MTTHDRKDLPQDRGAPQVPAAETHTDREERKQKESDALDKALEETFPTSDPVSPFVPAIPTESAQSENQMARTQACAHASCSCTVIAPEVWCSEACKDSQQGYQHADSGRCECGHADCVAR